MSTTPRTLDMGSILADRSNRVVVCCGAGGVGKTTTAAAMALRAAEYGRSVVVLTIDPARRLAQALGIKDLGNTPQRVPLDDGVPGELSAMMLDQKRAFDEVVRRYASDPAVLNRIMNNSIYQQISSSLAGSHEYAAVSKLYELAQTTDYDLLVLDTPPTENALDFLDAPDKVSQAVDSPAVQWIMKPYTQAGTWSLRMLGMGSAIVLRGLARFAGSAFLAQIAEFFVEFSQVMTGFRERALQVRTLLRKPEVSFVLVCSPEPLSVEEALYFHERLMAAQMAVGGCVVNRVHAPGPTMPEDLMPLLVSRSELAGVGRDDVQKLADELSRTYQEQQILATADARSLERLAQTVKVVPRRIPMLEQDIHDAAGIALVSQYLVP